MAGFIPAIHALLVELPQRHGCHRKPGLPDFRINYLGAGMTIPTEMITR
jgi:hypothetical protein